MSDLSSAQGSPYQEAAALYAAAIERLARAYEADRDKQRDLVQDIHIALWRSLASFNGACSIRTWVYRIAHNTAVSHVVRERRNRAQTMVSLEEMPEVRTSESAAGRQQSLEQLLAMVRKLKPIDRQVILAYLEDMDAATIAEITGLSASKVATQIHRIKSILSRRFQEGVRHDK
jgi:RNA polymerase sigma-70 factor (ECF subfamily)